LEQVTATVNTSATTGTFYRLLADGSSLTYAPGTTTFGTNAIFTTEEAAKHALYLILYGSDNGTAVSTGISSALATAAWSSGWAVPTNYAGMIEEYTNGLCYYRFDFGSGTSNSTTGDGITHEVERNYQYQAKITAFTTIGVNDPDKLDDDPYTPDATPTYVTVTISVVPWATKEAAQPL
jgi:hypothetical protein